MASRPYSTTTDTEIQISIVLDNYSCLYSTFTEPRVVSLEEPSTRVMKCFYLLQMRFEISESANIESKNDVIFST
jgi:hypothetical protein